MKLNVKAALKSLLVTVLSLFAVVGVLNAATTIGENITTAGTLAVTGASTFTGSLGDIILTTASSTGLVKVNSLRVGPNSTESPTVSGMVFGTCNFKTDETLDISLTTASTTYLVCGDATGVLSGDKVFVQATSSLPVNVFVIAASSTAADTISLRLGIASGTVSTGLISVNFWAVR